MKNLKAFTMIELVFVIVVLGILAGIAVPRLAATRDDATIAKMRGDIAAIRSGLSLVRSENMMRGETKWPGLEANPDVAGTLFEGVLQQPIYPMKAGGRNGWTLVTNGNANATSTYRASVAGKSTTFDYYPTRDSIPTSGANKDRNVGSFDCNHADDLCQS
ncbi:prepilin-type N-terminal cleavage/methylation domain-containing protein, partial [uncultured Campylobacter sp.]|uniref:prepilin-type N-terminal cleavage/methylation domain-containing protein n=1 Tax=uncultured Campylobacter sp. TaxID=218934 RepID=UPI0026394748